jgi:hypothetical protein
LVQQSIEPDMDLPDLHAGVGLLLEVPLPTSVTAQQGRVHRRGARPSLVPWLASPFVVADVLGGKLLVYAGAGSTKLPVVGVDVPGPHRWLHPVVCLDAQPLMVDAGLDQPTRGRWAACAWSRRWSACCIPASRHQPNPTNQSAVKVDVSI